MSAVSRDLGVSQDEDEAKKKATAPEPDALQFLNSSEAAKSVAKKSGVMRTLMDALGGNK